MARDFRYVVQTLFELGAATGPIDVEVAAADVEALVLPLLDQPIGEIAYGDILAQVLRVATRHRIRLPRELVLLVKPPVLRALREGDGAQLPDPQRPRPARHARGRTLGRRADIKEEPVMPTIRHLGRPAARAIRLAGAFATVPIRTTAAVLDSPRTARSDPASQRLDELGGQGWRTIEVRLESRRTEVRLERGDERCTVAGETLAFAAYATLAGARAGALVHHHTA